jgi:hypothetical protein
MLVKTLLAIALSGAISPASVSAYKLYHQSLYPVLFRCLFSDQMDCNFADAAALMSNLATCTTYGFTEIWPIEVTSTQTTTVNIVTTQTSTVYVTATGAYIITFDHARSHRPSRPTQRLSLIPLIPPLSDPDSVLAFFPSLSFARCYLLESVDANITVPSSHGAQAGMHDDGQRRHNRRV